ncbi:MAG: beta-galactosidase, partial [Victivallales bacterium]|nr:beta-galactosidase [Victivallales bacterium]
MKRILWLICSVVLSYGLLGKDWKVGENLKGAGVRTVQKEGHGMTVKFEDVAGAPFAGAALRIHIDQVPAGETQSWKKQVCMDSSFSVQPGMKFRVSYWIRGNAPGAMFVENAMYLAPFGLLGKKARQNVEFGTQWKQVSTEFEVENDYVGPASMPRFQPGTLPAGTDVWIGGLKVELLNELLPYNLTPEWKMLRGDNLPVDRIPDGTSTVSLKDNTYLFPDFKNRACATFYQEVEAKRDGNMTVGAAADWWFECFVNGNLAYSTMEKGNMVSTFQPTDYPFQLPLKKGRNLVAVRVFSGSAGWRFVFGKVQGIYGNPEKRRIFQIKEGPNYRPVDPDHFYTVAPGTVLDFSNLIERDRPAGKRGRLIIGANGHPVFEKTPNRPERFQAFNFLFDMWKMQLHMWTRKQFDDYAAAIERRGYNFIRLHLPENFLRGWEPYLKNRNVAEMDPAKLPTTEEEIEKFLDKGNLERFDMMFAAFKEHGIYVTTDLSGRYGITGSYATTHPLSLKGLLFYDQRARAYWKTWTKYFLSHVNPYTGLAYKDDPALVLLNFINEQDLRFADGLPFCRVPFREWLVKKYGNDAALSKAWGEKVSLDALPDITETAIQKA